jgi:ATP synthase protein I
VTPSVIAAQSGPFSPACGIKKISLYSRNCIQARKIVSKAALKTTRASVYRWFLFQSMAVVVVSLVALILQGIQFAQSVLLGGVICLLPNLLFARWWFAYYRVQAVRKIVGIFFCAELLKLVLIGLFFVLVVVWLPINILGCLLGFMAAQVAFWLAPLVHKKV